MVSAEHRGQQFGDSHTGALHGHDEDGNYVTQPYMRLSRGQLVDLHSDWRSRNLRATEASHEGSCGEHCRRFGFMGGPQHG